MGKVGFLIFRKSSIIYTYCQFYNYTGGTKTQKHPTYLVSNDSSKTVFKVIVKPLGFVFSYVDE